mmetsp:Transcript_12730/g.32024  ORF Transcript_12730/g.32024 Transcript_12730/m.32024 type:complete len:323 (-) Transcript_12730:2031-2999(-)
MLQGPLLPLCSNHIGNRHLEAEYQQDDDGGIDTPSDARLVAILAAANLLAVPRALKALRFVGEGGEEHEARQRIDLGAEEGHELQIVKGLADEGGGEGVGDDEGCEAQAGACSLNHGSVDDHEDQGNHHPPHNVHRVPPYVVDMVSLVQEVEAAVCHEVIVLSLCPRVDKHTKGYPQHNHHNVDGGNGSHQDVVAIPTFHLGRHLEVLLPVLKLPALECAEALEAYLVVADYNHGQYRATHVRPDFEHKRPFVGAASGEEVSNGKVYEVYHRKEDGKHQLEVKEVTLAERRWARRNEINLEVDQPKKGVEKVEVRVPMQRKV